MSKFINLLLCINFLSRPCVPTEFDKESNSVVLLNLACRIGLAPAELYVIFNSKSRLSSTTIKSVIMTRGKHNEIISACLDLCIGCSHIIKVS